MATLPPAAERARKILADHPLWYHSIELAPGVVTPGVAPVEYWKGIFQRLRLPDMRGKSVLDIGAYDGFFSFEAERHGAARVVAMDDYVWSIDSVARREDQARGRIDAAPRTEAYLHNYWKPEELPGKRPFDAVHAFFGSNVQAVVGSFLKRAPAEIGRFDVVLFLGVLYHMVDPVEAMRRAAGFVAPGGLLLIESAAIDLPGAPDSPFLEFYPTNEFNGDASNWFAPNMRAIEGLTVAAGLEEFRPLQGPPPRPAVVTEPLRTRYRAMASARKPG